MKTLSSLLFLVLFAVCPVAAQDAADDSSEQAPPPTAAPAEVPAPTDSVGPVSAPDQAPPPASEQAPVVSDKRCNTDFLETLAKTRGVATPDEPAGASHKLNFGDPKVCDAATWRHLAFGDPLVWRNADMKNHWGFGSDGYRASLLLVADDFFRAFDPRALEVLTAADFVIRAAEDLGIVTTADSEKSLSELLPGASGGPFGALKPKTVLFVSEGEQTAKISRDQLGPTFRLLLDERGESKGGGTAVLRFRRAVFALNAELGRRGDSNTVVLRRMGKVLPNVNDFTPGLSNNYVYVAGKDAVLDDVKFGRMLESLVGAGDPSALDAAAPRADALLDRVDIGVRNLLAIRASQVEQIVTAAKTRLGKKTITQLEVSARAAEAVKDMPADSLPAAVLQRLAETPQYARLDSLYENRKRREGDVWVNSTAGQAMAAARDNLKAAALSATIEEVGGQKAVVFTQDGRKKRLRSLVPDNVEGDPAVRADAAAIISRLIIEGLPTDAKFQAARAAIRGAGQPGQPLRPNLTAAAAAVSRDVPPAIQKIKGGAAGCESPKDLVRNDYEKYAARQRAAAVAMAGANSRSRRDIEKKRDQEIEAVEIRCNKELEAAAAIKKDYFDARIVVERARKRAKDKILERCIAQRQAINVAAQARFEKLAAQEQGDRNPDALRGQARADVAAGFRLAIASSVETLRKEYTTAGSPRLRELSRMTGDSPRLTWYTGRWFELNWPLDPSDASKLKLTTAIGACANALGLDETKLGSSYRNPENPNNVDRYCKIKEELKSLIISRANQSARIPVRRNP